MPCRRLKASASLHRISRRPRERRGEGGGECVVANVRPRDAPLRDYWGAFAGCPRVQTAFIQCSPSLAKVPRDCDPSISVTKAIPSGVGDHLPAVLKSSPTSSACAERLSVPAAFRFKRSVAGIGTPEYSIVLVETQLPTMSLTGSAPAWGAPDPVDGVPVATRVPVVAEPPEGCCGAHPAVSSSSAVKSMRAARTSTPQSVSRTTDVGGWSAWSHPRV